MLIEEIIFLFNRYGEHQNLNRVVRRQRRMCIRARRWGSNVFGYVNRCPHHGARLDWERDQFLDAYGTRLMCGKHGALFDLASGDCLEGPCAGQGLEQVRLAVLDDDICVRGTCLADDADHEA